MSQPPNYGEPPEERDPSASSGESGPVPPEGGPSPQQPPPEPGPQYPPNGPGQQYPPQGGPEQPPPGAPQGPAYPPGAGPLWVGGANPQYPGSAVPQSGAGGQGPPYPPPGGPGQGAPQYPYGPPPSGGGRNKGLIIGVAIAVGVLLAGVIGLFGINMMRGNENNAATDSTTEEQTGGDEKTTEEETTEPPPASDIVGLCLPYEPGYGAFDLGFDLSTSCGDTDAFWKVTNASDTSGASVDANGQLNDNQPAYDLCGAGYGVYQPGELWKTWYFTYDSSTGLVDQLLCAEAIGNPDADGRLPIMPDTGSCFDDSDLWWTVPCDQPGAQYVVVDSVAVDPPAVMTKDEADAASAPCSGGALFWQVVDIEGRTTDVLCGDQH
jgi:hypothetical protein